VNRKLRLQVKDETENEEAAIREAHRDKIKKLQKQLDDQYNGEETKIRQVLLLLFFPLRRETLNYVLPSTNIIFFIQWRLMVTSDLLFISCCFHLLCSVI
jgi:hypothetical protein